MPSISAAYVASTSAGSVLGRALDVVGRGDPDADLLGADRVGDRAGDLDGEAGAVLGAAAVLVGALVGARREELVR